MMLQIPGAIVAGAVLVYVGRWLEWPGWVTYAGIVGWVAHDLALFPFVRRAFDDSLPHRVGPRLLIGAPGRTVEVLDPRGYVRVRGELWQAELAEGGVLHGEEAIEVAEVRGLRLIVVPRPRDDQLARQPVDTRSRTRSTEDP